MVNDLPDKLILIDGECNLCHGTLKFVEKHSSPGIFYYSSLQSETGKNLLANNQLKETANSIIYLEHGKLYWKSSAALKIAKHLKFPYNLSYVLILLPRFLRDIAYDFVARNRYRWFGKKSSCELPSVGLRERLLK